MTDIAKLGYEVDSDPLRRATERLRKMGRQAGDSERATDRASQGMSRAFRNVFENVNKLLSRFRLIGFAAGTAGAALIAFRVQLAAVATAAAGVFVEVKFGAFRDRLRSVSATTENLRKNMALLTSVANESGVRAVGIGEGFAKLFATMQSGGSTAQATAQTLRGLTVAAAALGLSTDDVNKVLDKFAGLAQQGGATVSELKTALEFTNDPAAVLASTLGVTEQQLAAMEEKGVIVVGALDDIARKLLANAEVSRDLSFAWNTLVNTFTALLQKFNELGVIDAIIVQLRRFNELLKTEEAQRQIKQLADAAIRFFSDTLPSFVRAVYQSWDQIVRAFKIGVGILIGGAAGGIIGALVGGVLGASDTLRTLFIKIAGNALSSFSNMESSADNAARGMLAVFNVLIRGVAGLADAIRVGFGGIVGVFEAAGKTVGAAAAQITLLFQGNVEAALRVGELWKSDMGAIFDGFVNDLGPKYSLFVENALDANKKLAEGLSKTNATINGSITGSAPRPVAGGGSSFSLLPPDSAAATPQRTEELARGRALIRAEEEHRRVKQSLVQSLETQSEAARRVFEQRRSQIEAIITDERRKKELLTRNEQQLYDRLSEISGQGASKINEQLRSIQFAAQDVFSNVEDAIIRFAQTGKLAFDDLVNSIIEDILRLTVQQTISQPLARALSAGISGAFGGFFNSAAGTTFTSAGSSLLGGSPALALPGKAEGGPVSAGRAYIVGERGPEVFQPANNGAILPNNFNSETNLKVEIINEGEPINVQRTEQTTQPNGEKLYRLFVGRMQQDIGRENGPMAKTLQNTYPSLARGR